MEDYYVRSRGRVTGPFSLDAIQQLIKRGKISRFDQVSQDRSAWRSVADAAELSPPVAARRMAHAVVAADEPSLSDRAPADSLASHGADAPAGISADVMFYYAQNGVAVGPVPFAVLRSLATNGTLKPTDQVWIEGAEIASPARQVPMLAALYSNRRQQSEALGYETHYDGDLAESVRSAQSYATVVYFIVAGLTLVFHFIPWAIVDGRGIWWWDGNNWEIAAGIYAILASIALLVATPLIIGVARPIVATSLIGVKTAFIVFTLISNVAHVNGVAAVGGLLFVGLIFFSVLLAVVNRIRPRFVDGGPLSLRVLHIVFSSLVTLIALGAAIYLAASGKRAFTAASWVSIVGYILSCLSTLGFLTAGVVAIVSSSATFKRSLAAISDLALISAGAIYLLALIALMPWGELRTGSNYSLLLYSLTVGIILFLTTALWLATAFGELLTWCYRRYALDSFGR